MVFTALNVSANSNLQYLNCAINQLTIMDVGNNANLVHLECNLNQLTTLVFNNNTSLLRLFCDDNQLTSLNLSSLTELETLVCTNNQLTYLNIKNGNNTNILLFKAKSNPNLICIQVDDVSYSSNYWTDIDTTATFNTICNTNVNNIAASEINLTAYPNPTSGNLTLTTDNIKGDFVVEVRNVMGQLLFTQNNLATSFVALELDGPTGVYMVSVKTLQGEAVLKVIKN